MRTPASREKDCPALVAGPPHPLVPLARLQPGPNQELQFEYDTSLFYREFAFAPTAPHRVLSTVLNAGADAGGPLSSYQLGLLHLLLSSIIIE